jgi:hypothetical protein
MGKVRLVEDDPAVRMARVEDECLEVVRVADDKAPAVRG